MDENVRRGREAFIDAISRAEKTQETKIPKETPKKTEEKVKGVTEDEPGIISRIADKVVGYTGKVVGRPIY